MTDTMTQPTTDATTDHADALQATLIELIELSLQAKQAHWNLVGPTFKPIHEFLDEMTDEFRGWYDTVAERLAAIDVAPDGRTTTLAESAPFDQLPAGFLSIDKVIALFDERVSAVARRIRQRIDRLGDIDVISQGILIEIAHGLEKQRWMLRAHSRG